MEVAVYVPDSSLPGKGDSGWTSLFLLTWSELDVAAVTGFLFVVIIGGRRDAGTTWIKPKASEKENGFFTTKWNILGDNKWNFLVSQWRYMLFFSCKFICSHYLDFTSQACKLAQSLQSSLTLSVSQTIDHQVVLSIRFSMQEYWSELPLPPPGVLTNWGLKSISPASPEFQVDSLPQSQQGNLDKDIYEFKNNYPFAI